MDDLRQLIHQAQKRDTDAFDALVSFYREFALRYACSIIGDREAAQDIVQEAFIQAYLHLPSLREPEVFPVWLRAIVSHCSSRVMRRKRLPIVPLDAIAEYTIENVDATAVELSEVVHKAIRQLPDHERVVTQLYYLEGFTQQEIADMLSVPLTTVNNRLHASRRRMKPQLLPLREPGNRQQEKEATTMLTYNTTQRTLLKGDAVFTIRIMTEADLPAMRRLDAEITAGLEFANAQRSPGSESYPGGPWAEDVWLCAHFQRCQAAGNITLLAENADDKLVGFADLWATVEPAPFGSSLCVEVVDYLWEYHALGLDMIFLQEAEKVAIAAGIPALDTRADVSGSDYSALRHLGLQVFYESDRIICNCAALQGGKLPAKRLIAQAEFDPSDLLRINHWAPTDFDFTHDPGRPPAHEFFVGGHRVIADFWRLWKPGQQVPISCELFAPPQALKSQVLMTKILKATATIAASLGAKDLELPYPSALSLDSSPNWLDKREFEWAWMRKVVTMPE